MGSYSSVSIYFINKMGAYRTVSNRNTTSNTPFCKNLENFAIKSLSADSYRMVQFNKCIVKQENYG